MNSCRNTEGLRGKKENNSSEKQNCNPSGNSLPPELRLDMRASPPMNQNGDDCIAACGDRNEELNSLRHLISGRRLTFG